jgi:hypothetical protein
MKSGKTRRGLVSFTSILSSIVFLFSLKSLIAFRGASKMFMINGDPPLWLEWVFWIEMESLGLGIASTF